MPLLDENEEMELGGCGFGAKIRRLVEGEVLILMICVKSLLSMSFSQPSKQLLLNLDMEFASAVYLLFHS